MKIAFLLYPTSQVKVNEDSSFWIMHELAARGHAVFHFESAGLSWQDGSPHARLSRSRLHPKKGFLPSPPARNAADLSRMDCIFIRKEPPFDNEYLYALQLLDGLKHRVFILNDPAGIALSNEKMFALHFPRYTPQSMVTQAAAEAKKFIAELKTGAVVKPLNNKAGTGIFATSTGDKNLSSLLDMATAKGQSKVLIQRFLPASRQGDKRLLILDGRLIGAFLRKPPVSDFRSNLSIGGSMHRCAVNAKEKKLVEVLAPKLSAHGLYFVGIDVIGGLLSEANVTSPSGIPEINSLYRVRLEKKVADFLERRLQN